MIVKVKICTTGKILVKFVPGIYYNYLFVKYVVCVQERTTRSDMKENLKMSVPKID